MRGDLQFENLINSDLIQQSIQQNVDFDQFELMGPQTSVWIEDLLVLTFYLQILQLFQACQFLSKPALLQLQFQIKVIEMGQSSSDKVLGDTKKRRKRSTYAKISLKNKIIFFQKVINQKRNLRQTANKLGIKYSTAKTLIRNYTGIKELQDSNLVKALCLDFNTKSKTKKRCTYKLIDGHQQHQSGEQLQRCKNRDVSQNKIEIVSKFLSIQQQ